MVQCKSDATWCSLMQNFLNYDTYSFACFREIYRICCWRYLWFCNRSKGNAVKRYTQIIGGCINLCILHHLKREKMQGSKNIDPQTLYSNIYWSKFVGDKGLTLMNTYVCLSIFVPQKGRPFSVFGRGETGWSPMKILEFAFDILFVNLLYPTNRGLLIQIFQSPPLSD